MDLLYVQTGNIPDLGSFLMEGFTANGNLDLYDYVRDHNGFGITFNIAYGVELVFRGTEDIPMIAYNGRENHAINQIMLNYKGVICEVYAFGVHVIDTVSIINHKNGFFHSNEVNHYVRESKDVINALNQAILENDNETVRDLNELIENARVIMIGTPAVTGFGTLGIPNKMYELNEIYCLL